MVLKSKRTNKNFYKKGKRTIKVGSFYIRRNNSSINNNGKTYYDIIKPKPFTANENEGNYEFVSNNPYNHLNGFVTSANNNQPYNRLKRINNSNKKSSSNNNLYQTIGSEWYRKYGSVVSHGPIYNRTKNNTIGNNSPINSGKNTIPELPQKKSINGNYYSQNEEKPVQHIYNNLDSRSSINFNTESAFKHTYGNKSPIISKKNTIQKINNVFKLGELNIKLQKKEELNNKLDNLLFKETNPQHK